MKKMLFASIILLSAGLLQARCCTQRTSCPTRGTTCEPTKPICCKTIQVPTTVMVDKVIQVEPRRVITPVADVIEYIPQAALKVITPQPPIQQCDKIHYVCQPDKVRCLKQASIISYECPADCR